MFAILEALPKAKEELDTPETGDNPPVEDKADSKIDRNRGGPTEESENAAAKAGISASTSDSSDITYDDKYVHTPIPLPDSERQPERNPEPVRRPTTRSRRRRV